MACLDQFAPPEHARGVRDEPIVLRGNRPPLLLGCLGLAALVVLVGAAIGSCVVFLESGADEGEAVLLPLDAYPPGSVDYIGEENLFIVRTVDGAVLALSDLDAANRATPGRRCRARLLSFGEAGLSAGVTARVTQPAAGVEFVLTETCNGATYDITGTRIDLEAGANLDRYGVRLDGRGRVVVDLTERTCTARTDTAPREAVACPE
jgi:hypothetical protein